MLTAGELLQLLEWERSTTVAELTEQQIQQLCSFQVIPHDNIETVITMNRSIFLSRTETSKLATTDSVLFLKFRNVLSMSRSWRLKEGEKNTTQHSFSVVFE